MGVRTFSHAEFTNCADIRPVEFVVHEGRYAVGHALDDDGMVTEETAFHGFHLARVFEDDIVS